MSYVLGQAAVLAAIGVAVGLMGCALEPLIPGRASLGPWRTLARLVLGTGGWAMATFVLAAAGMLTPTALALLATTTALVGGGAWWRARTTDAHADVGTPRTWPRISALDTTAATGALAIIAPAFLLIIGPTVSWDADVYHLTLPRLYLEHGGFIAQPNLVYGHWPQVVELLFTDAMALGSYVSAKLVHLFFGLALLAVVGRAARNTAGPVAGWLAVALVLANDVVFFELRSAYVDLAYAFFLLAAVLLLDRACSAPDRGDQRRAGAGTSLLLAGIAGGLMAGVKVTGIVGAAAAAVIYLPVLRREGWPAWRCSLLYGLPVLALWLPWLVKAAIETGNPIYPLAWHWWGGDHWSAALGQQLGSWQQSIGMGRAPLDYLLLPYRVITEGGRGYAHFDGSISSVWLLMVPLSLLAVRQRPLVRRALAVAGVYFVAWALSSQQMRFLIPILPLLALAAAIAVADLLARVRLPLRPLLGATTIAAALLLAATTHAHVLVTGYQRLALYRQADPVSLRAAAVPEVFRWIDANLPADATILMLNTNQGFFCPRPYIADSFFEASQIADWLGDAQSVLDLRQRLRQAGITHVLWSAKDWQIDWPSSLAEMLGNRTWAEPLFRDRRGHTVLRLH